MIDLRSDTVTRPTARMRRVMAEADVGDDVFGEDPTVNELEAEVAHTLGKEEAVFVPSGTMSNQLGVYASVDSGDELWAHSASHILGNEQGASSVLARALPRSFTETEGCPSDAWLAWWGSGAEDIHRARPRLVCLENTLIGRVIPLEEQARVAAFAHAHGMRLHLDGARLWNAAVALGAAPAEVAAGADTVSVCFSKGLGAPVGSALAGDAAAIARARRARKLFGGSMRQAGVLAAGARYALWHHRERLADDHARATRLAAELDGVARLTASARTNMVLVNTPPGAAARYARAFTEHGVGCAPIDPDTVRLVVHLHITDADVAAAATRVRRAAVDH